MEGTNVQGCNLYQLSQDKAKDINVLPSLDLIFLFEWFKILCKI